MIIQDILTSNSLHRLLVKPAIKNGVLKTKYGSIDLSNQHQFIQSLIYWNAYERKEIESIRKYLNRKLDIIELGSSIGMVSLAVGQMLKGSTNKFVSVEANPFLLDNLKRSAELNQYNIHFINAAVCYTDPAVHFSIDSKNLGSKIADVQDETNVVVESTTLSKLFHENQLGEYALICDIEGAESHILNYESDKEVMDKCRQILIELHDTSLGEKKYTKNMLAELMAVKFSMRLVFSAGNIWVFEK